MPLSLFDLDRDSDEEGVDREDFFEKLLISCIGIDVCVGVSVSVGVVIDDGTVFAEVLVLALMLVMVLVILLMLVLPQACGVGDGIYVPVGICCWHVVSCFHFSMV